LITDFQLLQMKKILFISIVLFSSITSCNKKLEIDPTQSIDEAQVFTSDANIKKALNGAYDAASSGYVLGGDMMLYSELLAANGELRWDGTFNQPREIINKAILTNNSYVRDTYSNSYKAVNICNNILANLAVVDPADKDRIEGEALFLRGTIYYQLAVLYTKPYSAGNVNTNLGLSLITKPTVGNISDSNFVPRSTLQQTYSFILNDLTRAKSLLPEDNGIYANTSAASAILSRVYLQLGDYAMARDEANTVIESGFYSLTDTYEAAFNNTTNSTEDIFAIQVSSQDGANDMQLFWSIRAEGARSGDVDVLQKHLSLYPDTTGDARYNLFYEDGAVWRSGKWRKQYRNLPFIRLAETYLTRAECNFRLSSTIGATPFDDISIIRTRAGLATDPAYITLDNILKERKLELAHEGQAIQDAKRLKETIETLPYDSPKLVLPIPISEINAVGPSILQQNEGY